MSTIAAQPAKTGVWRRYRWKRVVNLGRLLIADDFQNHALTSAVASKLDRLVDLLSIQALDGIVKPTLGTNFGMLFERIINMTWPSIFFECIEYKFLILGRPFEPFYHSFPKSKLAAFPIPNRPNEGCLIYRHRSIRLGMYNGVGDRVRLAVAIERSKSNEWNTIVLGESV